MGAQEETSNEKQSEKTYLVMLTALMPSQDSDAGAFREPKDDTASFGAWFDTLEAAEKWIGDFEKLLKTPRTVSSISASVWEEPKGGYSRYPKLLATRLIGAGSELTYLDDDNDVHGWALKRKEPMTECGWLVGGTIDRLPFWVKPLVKEGKIELYVDGEAGHNITGARVKTNGLMYDGWRIAFAGDWVVKKSDEALTVYLDADVKEEYSVEPDERGGAA